MNLLWRNIIRFCYFCKRCLGVIFRCLLTLCVCWVNLRHSRRLWWDSYVKGDTTITRIEVSIVINHNNTKSITNKNICRYQSLKVSQTAHLTGHYSQTIPFYSRENIKEYKKCLRWYLKTTNILQQIDWLTMKHKPFLIFRNIILINRIFRICVSLNHVTFQIKPRIWQ